MEGRTWVSVESYETLQTKKEIGILKNIRGIIRLLPDNSKLSEKINGSSLWKYNSKQSCSTWYIMINQSGK